MNYPTLGFKRSIATQLLHKVDDQSACLPNVFKFSMLEDMY